jgi:chromosome transmission fidelity protein 18
MRLTLLGILWTHEAFCSDARSGQVVDERIRPAIESGYAVGSAKPVLVVIDEIDGATGDNVSHEHPPNRGIC